MITEYTPYQTKIKTYTVIDIDEKLPNAGHTNLNYAIASKHSLV